MWYELCVCWSQPWVALKWLNRFRCCLGCGLGLDQGTMCWWGPDPPRGRGNFGGHLPTYCKYREYQACRQYLNLTWQVAAVMWSFAASTVASCCRWSWISWCCPYLAASRTSAASTVESRVGWSDQRFIRMLQDSPCSRTVDASSCRSCVLRVRPGSCQHTVTTVGLLRNICFNCDDKCLGQSTDQAVCQASAWPTCYMLPVSTGHQSYWSVNTDHASRFITGKWLYICTFFTVTFCPEVTAVSCWNPNMNHFFCIVFCFSSWYCNWFSHIHNLSSAIFQFLWVDHIFLSPAVSIYLYSVHPFWLCTHTPV